MTKINPKLADEIKAANDNSWFVGCEKNEDGEPLVRVGGKLIGTVKQIKDFLSQWQDTNVYLDNIVDDINADLNSKLDWVGSAVSFTQNCITSLQAQIANDKSAFETRVIEIVRKAKKTGQL